MFGNKMLRKIQSFSVYLGNASTNKIAKDLAEAIVYHVGNDLDILQHFDKNYGLVF